MRDCVGVGLPAGTITRELGKLAEVGLLKCQKRGNQQTPDPCLWLRGARSRDGRQ